MSGAVSTVPLVLTFIAGTLASGNARATQTAPGRVSADIVNQVGTTLRWERIPDSSMDTVFNPAVDDVWSSAPNSWSKIQSAWSGGVCAGNELFVWGGGHGDGAHNGLLAVNVLNGKWRRVTEPSPIWTEATCPKGLCKTSTGECPLGECNTGPDGRPVARHTYYLLASDGRAIYNVGGGIWSKGNAGEGPSTWKFDLATGKWSHLPNNSPVLRGHGSLVAAGGNLYHMTGSGFAVMSPTGIWKEPGNLSGRGGATGLVYVPSVDRIYAFGDGSAWYASRARWGSERTPIASPPQLISQRGIGITYHSGTDLVLLWNGGSRITTLDPKTNRWGEFAPKGDPGPALEKGTYGRFSFCGGRVVVVNGTSRDLWSVNLSGAAPAPLPPSDPKPTPSPSPEHPATPSPELPAPTPSPERPAPSPRPGDPLPPPSQTTSLAPYYAEPPGDKLVQAQCGSQSEWQIIDVTTNSDVTNLKQLISSDTRAIVRVHWRPEPYPALVVKNGRCVKVAGQPGPNGEKPLVGGVNGTKAFRGTVRPGGLIIENLEVSPGKVRILDPTLSVSTGDCLGVPNDRMFFIIRESEVSRCNHHAFVTSHAHHLYVEIGRSYFSQAGSHLAYIDHVAMGYVYESAFESPGWGHALRCVGLRCRIERTQVSNVQLDGTVLSRGGSNPFQPKQTYVGMAPLEVYVCGQNEIRDVEAVFLADDNYNGRFAATVRDRDAFRTCDVGEVVDGQWTRLKWGDPDFMDPRRWARVTPLVTRVDTMRVNCVGPTKCVGWDVKGSYPVMDDSQKDDLQTWLKSSAFGVWEDMRRAIPQAHPEWDWVASVTLPEHRQSFLQGKIMNRVPLPVPIPAWFQRTQVVFRNLMVQGGSDLRNEGTPDTYCYGLPPLEDSAGNVLNECSQQFDGERYRRGEIIFQ